MTNTNYRKERIERLLHELRHEVTRGMMEWEIDETLGFEFFVPISKRIKDGVVHCRFSTRPMQLVEYLVAAGPNSSGPRLTVVK